MCGITGFFSPKTPIRTTRYYAAHSLISHRGPDDEGFVASSDNMIMAFKGDDTIAEFQELAHINTVANSNIILGHRRLSIIDLSSHGHQPFSNESERYFIVYNGEIFNYLELRVELINAGYRFRTSSDTEVVLNAYMHWGVEAFNKFNGMWALAIYDNKEKELILCRDRFGIKPLFYLIENNALIFASENKFIRSFIDHSFKLNKNIFTAYLEKCLINHSLETFWDNINELEPAHYFVYSCIKKTINRYWNYNPAIVSYSHNDAIDKFTTLFEDSLKLRMRSDVEVGTLLSGGLDSTTIVCALNRLGFINNNNFRSFSAVFSEEKFSEKKFIDETVEQNSLDAHFIYPKPELLDEYIDKLLLHVEEPFRSLSVYSQYLIYEHIQEKTSVKVVLNGQGADELFGGYTVHYHYLFVELIRRGKLGQLINELTKYCKNRKVTPASAFKQILGLARHRFPEKDYFNRMTFKELSFSAMREYLKYDDRTSMAFGVEARVPFLDYRLVEYAYSLDTTYKISNFENKKILRDYSRKIIPPIVAERTDKMGFVSPQEKWQQSVLKDNINVAITQFPDDIYPMIKDIRTEYLKYGHTTANWDKYWRVYCAYKWLQLNKVV